MAEPTREHMKIEKFKDLNKPARRLREEMGAEGYMDHTPFFDSLKKYGKARRGSDPYPAPAPDSRR